MRNKTFQVDIICPWWKRPDIVLVHCRSMERFIKDSPKWVKLRYTCIISPEDPCRRELEEIAFSFGFTVLSYKNIPVSCKLNAGINWILQNRRPDYLMNMGSDDCNSAEIWDIYRPYMEKKRAIFGIDSCFICDVATKESYYLDHYNDKFPVGVLRMIRSDMIRELHIYNHLDLYPYGVDRGLDTASLQRLMKFGITPDVIHLDWRPLTVGIKCDTTINHFMHLSVLEKAKRIEFETIKHLIK